MDAIAESIALIKEGKAPRLLQKEDGATYEPPCDDRAACIDWSKAAQDVYNLIRGCDPQPGAYADLKGDKIRFFNARLIKENDKQAPGTILGLDDQGLRVAVDGGCLLIGKMKAATGKKAAAIALAAECGLHPGVRFTT